MTCTEAQIMLSSFVDNELDETNDDDVFRHVASCGECRQFLRTSMRTRQEMLEMHLTTPRPGFDERVIRSIATSHARSVTSGVLRVTLPVSVAASLVGLLIVISLVLSPLILQDTSRAFPDRREFVTPGLPPEVQAQLSEILQ